jgi:hypothetical protein
MAARSFPAVGLVAALLLFQGRDSLAQAQGRSPADDVPRMESVRTTRATGTFVVKVLPLPADSSVDTGGFGRMSLDKQFSGDLKGRSAGQMVAAGTAVEGSAAYVAMERVTGTLNGRSGSFILMHNGTMSHGALELRIIVVPDSGTGELTGLAGTMKIIIEGGKHSWEFEYSIAGR